MSEVEKFKCIGYMVGRSRVGGGEYVRLSDFDRVTAERDAALGREAALQEELDLVNLSFDSNFDAAQLARTERDALQQRMTAADERADVLEGLLQKSLRSLVPRMSPALIQDIKAALKPAETARCCTVSPEDRALLEAGDYTPEELFGVGGKPSCPKCAKP